MAARRSYGTGRLYQKAGSWYGRWRTGDRRVNRKLGAVRAPGSRDGLTRAGAEQALRKAMDRTPWWWPSPTGSASPSSGARLINHLEALGRKRSTVEGYGSALRVHLGPFFGEKPLGRITPQDVEAFIASLRARRGASAEESRTTSGRYTGIFELPPAGEGGRRRTRSRAPSGPGSGEDKEVRFLDHARDGGPAAGFRTTTSAGWSACSTSRPPPCGMRQGELWRCGGVTSTGAPGASGCGATTCAASSALRSRSVRAGRCR